MRNHDKMITTAVFVVLTVLLVGYVGSYYALAQVGPDVNIYYIDENAGLMDGYFVVNYRAGGKTAEAVFTPIYWLDRHVQSNFGIPGYDTTLFCRRDYR